MSVKVFIFAVLLPLFLLVINEISLINEFLSKIGYIFIASIIVWETTNRLIFLINSYVLRKVSPKKKIILITGCDSGFGYLTAVAANAYGFTVFATCLLSDEIGAKKLKKEVLRPDELVVIGCDVTKDKDVDHVHQVLMAYINNGYELWALVNNAGICVSGEAEWGTFQSNYGNVFDVNCFGTIKFTRKFLPLIRHSRGRIVIVSSGLGRITHASSVAYSMTKHALVAFADGLRLSLAQFGVEVTCVEPFAYLTSFVELDNMRIKQIWNETDLFLRQSYRLEHFKDVLKLNESVKNLIANKNPTEVSDAIMESITVAVPNKRQACGTLVTRAFCSLLTIIPTDFTFVIFKISERVFKLVTSKLTP